MIEACRTSENPNNATQDIMGIRSRKLLALRHLENRKPQASNSLQRLSLKYKAIQGSYKMIEERSKTIKGLNHDQKIFMHMLMNISQRWKIIKQENLIFAVIGKSSQGDPYKALLLKDPEKGIKVDLSPEMKKLKVLNIKVTCPQITLPDVKIKKNVEFAELERAEQILIDAEIMKELQEKVAENSEYVVSKNTKSSLELFVNVTLM